MAAAALPDAYCEVVIEPPVFQQVERALREGAISGAGARDRAGVFPLSRVNSGGADAERLAWEQWAKHAENAAVTAGLTKGLVGGLMGALGELQDNVFEHSGRPQSGIVAYAASDSAFELVVADAGRGVLASLRENPEFADLADSGAALRVAASDGASRHARSTGHGYGIGQLFRALAHDAAELRSVVARGANPMLGEDFRPVAWKFRRPPSLTGRSLRAGKSGDGFQRPYKGTRVVL